MKISQIKDIILQNLQKNKERNILPPLQEKFRYEKKEKTRRKDQKEKAYRYAEREKFRRDVETYGDIFYNWEEIMKEREDRLKREETERNKRVKKSKVLGKTWELMRVCKDFLEEWEDSWTLGTEKTEYMRRERNKSELEWEKEERFKKIEGKREEVRKKTMQTKLNFNISKLGKCGREEWEKDLRRERIEVQELKENLWTWRENGGGRTKNGKEKQNAPTKKSTEKKLKFIEDILERERDEKERFRALKEREKAEDTEEKEKKKIRLELKKTLEQKWQTVRWITHHLDENEEELIEMLGDMRREEEKKLESWQKLKRLEKIQILRREQGFDKLEQSGPTWRNKNLQSAEEFITPFQEEKHYQIQFRPKCRSGGKKGGRL